MGDMEASPPWAGEPLSSLNSRSLALAWASAVRRVHHGRPGTSPLAPSLPYRGGGDLISHGQLQRIVCQPALFKTRRDSVSSAPEARHARAPLEQPRCCGTCLRQGSPALLRPAMHASTPLGALSTSLAAAATWPPPLVVKAVKRGDC